MTALDTLNGLHTGRYIIHTVDRRQWEIDLDTRSAWCGGVCDDLIRLIDATVGVPLRFAIRDARDGIAATIRREEPISRISVLDPGAICA
jgi:hypothetical protein